MGLFLQLLARGLITGSLYALLGVSWGIIYNTTRTFHFAHGFVYTLASYLILVPVGLSLPLIPSLLVGLIAATAAASQLSVFLTAMGIMIAGQSLILLIFGPDSRPLEGFPERIISLGPITLTSIDLFTVFLAWIVMAILFLFLARTKAGMMIRAVSSNPEKATFIGIDSKKIFLLVFGIGSLLVGIASFLATLDRPANPNIGLHALLISFITVFLGGVGNLKGAMIGGLILGIAESLVIMVLPTEYKMVVTFFILFLVILIKPEGLMGKKSV
ncbi:MAG: branched-chain amino acid ABC transporter permease [Deltaproteobacteria bacterium]|nr:branched-chain amino acid ABC transporter permease [Deltaproteobacteria bacterium]